MRVLRRIVSRFYVYILWFFLAFLAVGLLFSRLGDTDAAHKVTLFADVPAMEDAALAAKLEEEMPEGIRMIKVHPFSYAMFDSDNLLSADLYIIPASHVEDYAGSFRSLAGASFDAEGGYVRDGELWGVRVWDAARGEGIAADYIDYPDEDCWLFFNAGSGHIRSISGEGDDAAIAVARRLLAMRGESSTERGEDGMREPAQGLPEGFLLGMDVSSVLAEERSGVKYYDVDGNERDLFAILADNGINTIRVRVWNDPYDANGNGYGGGNCDAAAAAEIGRRAAEHGMGLLVDFHYSDFWADPGKQFAPKAWAGMTIGEKSEALFSFTRESLETILAAGARIRMVQLGNETNGALAGETSWPNILSLMAAGARAVRETCPEAQIAVHFTDPEKAGSYAFYAGKLDEYGLDYDVFASSYYPFWHGTLDNLAAVLSAVAERYGKQVMVVETSYAWTDEDSDFFANTVSAQSAVDRPWPYTVQGQAEAVRAVIDTVARRTTNGIGVVYWEGAWISVGTNSWEENREKWERDGSGWASSFAAEYDPEDAGRWYGGSAVDNQAFFDASGRALESLKVFSFARTGAAPET
ncbi:MAG: glycosyl hydrolase 53 family protein [Oscillospiraceae bacterium]|nr:glycosyl hydrolase 53 family protein [Oscillospiraceae bacterium]